MYLVKSEQINTTFWWHERFSLALSIVFGEISIPVNVKHCGATFVASLPVPTPISKAEILSFIDNLDSRINMITKALNDVNEGEFTNHQYGLEGRCIYKPHKD